MGLSKEQGQGSLEHPLLSVPDLPGALGVGTHLLEHRPQPAGDACTKTHFRWVPPGGSDHSQNPFGRPSWSAAQDPAPHRATNTIAPSPPR